MPVITKGVSHKGGLLVHAYMHSCLNNYAQTWQLKVPKKSKMSCHTFVLLNVVKTVADLGSKAC